jgi:mRNA interferase MazF
MAKPSPTKGKVVLVRFPFDDLSSAKVRPAVCLTDPIGVYRHVLLAFVTSRIGEDLLPSDLSLNSRVPGFNATGLRVPSTLRLHRLMTASTSLIRREIGVLSPELQRSVAEKLRALFQL